MNEKYIHLANVLNITTNSAIELIERQAKYLKINTKLLINSYALLTEIKEKEQVKYKKTITTSNIKLLKYAHIIEDLYTNKGYGYVKISNYLKLNNKVTISKTAIANFINNNKFIKGV